MTRLLDNPAFASRFRDLARVRLNPRRHAMADALTHSEAVAARAAALATASGFTAAERDLLEDLGRAHDIGKSLGNARPETSLVVLDACGVTDPVLRALVRWHDTALPWWNASRKGQPPGDAAWRRLAGEVDLRHLALFMVADRVDAPGGWRRNLPTVWFHEQARRRGLLAAGLVLDLPGVASEISAGAVLVDGEGAARRALVIRTWTGVYELAKGGLEWDELLEEAACRELAEEAGVTGPLDVIAPLGRLAYDFVWEAESWHKHVHYFAVRARGDVALGPLPEGTRERRWVDRAEAASLPLVAEALRPILLAALSA
jgi:ADP-ribose pyrophosphatase YjhB (NUDIX family)